MRIRLALASAALGAGIISLACGDPTGSANPPAAVGPTPATGDPSDYVATPAGWVHRSCVYEVPDGAVVDRNGIVHVAGAVTRALPPCQFPTRQALRGGPLVRPDGQSSKPTNNGWMEYAYTTIPTTNFFKRLDANWTVPAAPLTRYTGSNQVYFSFPGTENGSYIIQPVIQYGTSAAGGSSTWMMASWHCNDGSNCIHSTLKPVATTDAMTGSVVGSNCNGSTCSWTITTRDITTGTQTVLTVTDNAEYRWATGGAVEVYGLTSCDEYPANGIYYTGIALKDSSLNALSPAWANVTPAAPNPSCNFAVASNASTVSLFHNPQSRLALGGLVGNCGQLCSTPAIKSIQASGSTITLQDNGGHTGTITLTGFTASGGLTASCGQLCNGGVINSVTASGTNVITLVDQAGHTGHITLTGATASGGFTGSCGVTCGPPGVAAIVAGGGNGLNMNDTYNHYGILQFH
jgi:hypothetical protein